MAEELTIALIGCGGMMGAHVNGYRELWQHDFRNFRIVACCDLRREAAEAMAGQVEEFQGTRPAVYESVEELLAAGGFDACDISVVHKDHHTVAVACMEAGKHVTIEKPLAITMRAGKRMLEAAERAGVKLHVAENYRRAVGERCNKWVIEQGRIGEPWLFVWEDLGERLWHWAWRDEKLAAGGGWTLDGGVHFADLFRYHVGPAETVYAVSRALWPQRYTEREPLGGELVQVDVEDTMVAILQFEGSPAVGNWLLTSQARGKQWSTRVLHGSEGALDWREGLFCGDLHVPRDKLEAEFMEALDEETRERYFPRGITDTVAHELKEFIDAVLYDAPMETDGLEGYKAEAVCLAAYESASAGRPVRVAEVEELAIEHYQGPINEALGIE